MLKKHNLPLIREGSAKDIYRVDDKTIAFGFTDTFSVFDVGRSADLIPGKAQAMCACAVQSFRIAEAIGVPTHFIEQIDDVTIRVKEAQIITDRPLSKQDENYVVPAELIYRLRGSGSILRDFKSGKKKPEDYGLPAGIIPAEGTPFPYPIHMTTTKFEDIDRDLSLEELCAMGGIDLKDLSEYWSMIDRLTGAVAIYLGKTPFVILDGKFECLMGPKREKMIGDVFCTPDEDRPAEITVDGRVIHYSKEFPRQYLIGIGYYSDLMKARSDGKEDIPIPRLPQEIINEFSRRYLDFARVYTGLEIKV